jgi:hypothetical protein
MFWSDPEFDDIRVDAALEKLAQEWESPAVLASYCKEVSAMQKQQHQSRQASPNPYGALISPPRPAHFARNASLAELSANGSMEPKSSGKGLGLDRRQPSQRSVRRGPSVEDRLLEFRHVAEAKRLAAKELQEQRELAAVTATPKICRKSEALVQQLASRTPVTERVATAAKPTASATANPPVDERRAATPTINEQSKALRRGLDAQREWLQSREERLVALRRAQEKERREHDTGRPFINPLSRIIASNRDALEGLDCLDVEDKLMIKQHKSLCKLEERRQTEEEALRGKSRSLDEASNSAAAVEQAAQRLFLDSQTRALKAEEKKKRKELLECIDEKTGQVLGQPLVGVAAAAADGTLPPSLVGKYRYVEPTPLTDLAKPRKGYLESEAATGRTGSSSVAATPAISEYSRLLAELKHGSDQDPTSTFSRLAEPRKDLSDAAPMPSFSPTINERSARLDSVKTPQGISRVDLLLERQKQYEAHRQRLAAERQLAAEEAERKKRRAEGIVPSSKLSTMNHMHQDPFTERMEAWQKRREVRLEKQREDKLAQVDHECTFQPSLKSVGASRTPDTSSRASTHRGN